MTLNEAYFEARRRLQAAGVENPSFDAACIFENHTGFPRIQLSLYGGGEREVPPGFWEDIARRANGEPLQYILGQWEFMGLPFKVGPGVLIPRPETELLCETAIDFLRGRKYPRMLELCAGSGCPAIAAARTVDCLEAFCLEYSREAVGYLEENVSLNDVRNRVHVLCGDMLDFAGNVGLPEGLDLILCNPPYVRSGDIAGLQREVREHEPVLALDGGEDGLKFYRAFAPWRSLLVAGGMAVFEVGAGQAAEVAGILRAAGLQDIFIKKDYAGIERVVGGYNKEGTV